MEIKAVAQRSLAHRVTLSGILVALALALSYLEHLFPLQLILPIPGVKLGLANLVTVIALVFLGRRAALLILLGRCVLAGLLFGTITSLLFSLSGGVFAFLAMIILLRGHPRWLSLVGVCIGGAAAHNIGQILVACVLFGTFTLIAYLPLLLLVSVLTGSLSGYVSTVVSGRFSAQQ